MTLLARVVGALEAQGVPHCLIGAAALAMHGVTRSTRDLDLLVGDPKALKRGMWAELEGTGVSVDARRGDSEDPLAGVVRLEAEDDRPIDLIVGRAAWQRAVVERARPVQLGALEIPVAEAPDIVLLKLYAGGPQDLWDIQQLLDTPAGSEIAAEAEIRLADLPAETRRTWDRIRIPEA